MFPEMIDNTHTDTDTQGVTPQGTTAQTLFFFFFFLYPHHGQAGMTKGNHTFFRGLGCDYDGGSYSVI